MNKILESYLSQRFFVTKIKTSRKFLNRTCKPRFFAMFNFATKIQTSRKFYYPTYQQRIILHIQFRKKTSGKFLNRIYQQRLFTIFNFATRIESSSYSIWTERKAKERKKERKKEKKKSNRSFRHILDPYLSQRRFTLSERLGEEEEEEERREERKKMEETRNNPTNYRDVPWKENGMT